MVIQNQEVLVLTEIAVNEFHESLRVSNTPAEYFERVGAILDCKNNLLKYPTNLGVPCELKVEGKRAVDINNAPLVHEYLGEMDRSNAADPRLWVYLSHVTYRTYMENRWPINETVENWKNRIEDRWLLPMGNTTRGRLVRHGVARLWWVAHLTYIHHREKGDSTNDPYFYTREVFKSEDRLNSIFDREVGALPQVMFCVLDHAASLGDKASDKYIGRIMQYLKLVNGYRDIGMLDESSIRKLVDDAALHANLTKALS